MAIYNPYSPSYNTNGTLNPSITGSQQYTNFSQQIPPMTYQSSIGTVFARYVSSEQDAYSNLPTPQTGSSFGIDGENMVLYAKFADGHMETYDLIQKVQPKPPEPITAESLSQILDQKLNDFETSLTKKFVVKREYYQNKGGSGNE